MPPVIHMHANTHTPIRAHTRTHARTHTQSHGCKETPENICGFNKLVVMATTDSYPHKDKDGMIRERERESDRETDRLPESETFRDVNRDVFTTIILLLLLYIYFYYYYYSDFSLQRERVQGSETYA